MPRLTAGHNLADTLPPPRIGLLRSPPFRIGRKESANPPGVQAGFSRLKAEVGESRKFQSLYRESGGGGGGRLRVGMAAQIPIVATTSTPGIVRNSKKRPASPSHNGSSAGGYSASKKKKVSAASFTQVCLGSSSLRVRGAVRGGARARAQGRAGQGEGAGP